MKTPAFGQLFRDTRSDWVRLRTLILLRWMAITGQLAAITVADRAYGLELPLGLCYMAVGASIIANLISVFVYPENKRLSEIEAMLTRDLEAERDKLAKEVEDYEAELAQRPDSRCTLSPADVDRLSGKRKR